MQTPSKTAIALAVGLALTACGDHSRDDDGPAAVNQKPAYLGTVTSTTYDGTSDDLLTAGLGASGLAAATPPAYNDPANPTARELRRNAIFANYRAVLDIAANSGYGSLYGPNVNAAGGVTNGSGMVAGTEYLAYADDGSGKQNVTLMVQVPSSFDPANPCIVTGTSSGSRGIYGAIGSAGEWGLKNNCAVAYADKGSGTGLYTFDDDSVNTLNGVRATRAAAAKNATFAPELTDAQRTAFAQQYPGRIAFKHAHSQQNPEKDWGKITLQAVEFAFYVLNERYGVQTSDGGRTVRFTPANTLTIASSISNGAGAALLAAEQDTKGLIDAVAATEPQIQPNKSTGYTVRQGSVNVPAQGKALLDYSSYAALYQPCIAGGAGRCTSLVQKGLLNGTDLVARQNDAKARLKAYGWTADAEPLQGLHALTNVLVAVTYVNAYGKFAVTDKVCGFNWAPVDASGNPIAFTAAQKAASFATQNGIVGTPVYEDSVGGAKAYSLGVSPSSGIEDQSLDGFLCLRGLATGIDPVTGNALTGDAAALSARVKAGMAEVLATGNLKGKPAVIVSGRSDALIPVNHASRAYVGLNAAVEGANSKLRYIEVTNANHFDSFTNALPNVIVPLHVYLFRALDAVYANLKNSATALPPSQLVRTTTRGDASVPITVQNVPVISAAPGINAITVSGTTVTVPD
ncbi:3-hydroxybutyrate oligomer hydrolase family protein [Pseudoduganella chitinolytica]|uniref:3-hydroxybutyrate oligomer hydrolase family protein n=1 Tax=Pseudoduganella chitinolytica TaxID=34070 RepID=A0ABY8B7Q4_9BURK|nr:3-hydroxybutyrate oligomer hydrolase family protein [Pseudoduganella chitinolytica]WEF31966.1 3-hydroxybutyrate oligomer hydrolase family protein [Pseudoduganella chitinolytica]